jgi:hypothetical protein
MRLNKTHRAAHQAAQPLSMARKLFRVRNALAVLHLQPHEREAMSQLADKLERRINPPAVQKEA